MIFKNSSKPFLDFGKTFSFNKKNLIMANFQSYFPLDYRLEKAKAFTELLIDTSFFLLSKLL